MNCVCAGYIREVTVHSKKYKRDELKFTHYMQKLRLHVGFVTSDLTKDVGQFPLTQCL